MFRKSFEWAFFEEFNTVQRMKRSFCEMKNTLIFDGCDTKTANYVLKQRNRNLLNILREKKK